MSGSVNVSVVIATRNRYPILRKTLGTLYSQTVWPKEIIVVDASDSSVQRPEMNEWKTGGCEVRWIEASERGAAIQRNQGVGVTQCPFILFMDDDVYLETDVLEKLWKGMQTLERAGAVGTMITNQKYTAPGRVTLSMYRLMSNKKLPSYAGMLIGPAWNLLPEDHPDLPEFVPCDWLNTTCTLYRKSCLPTPVFADHFKGYSLMEDVTLSVMISRAYSLWNARTARIFHDSQMGDHKNNMTDISRMELVNRHYVMTRVLNRTGFVHTLKLFIFEIFGIVTGVRHFGLRNLPKVILGKVKGILSIIDG